MGVGSPADSVVQLSGPGQVGGGGRLPSFPSSYCHSGVIHDALGTLSRLTEQIHWTKLRFFCVCDENAGVNFNDSVWDYCLNYLTAICGPLVGCTYCLECSSASGSKVFQFQISCVELSDKFLFIPRCPVSFRICHFVLWIWNGCGSSFYYKTTWNVTLLHRTMRNHTELHGTSQNCTEN